jgi:hypothetical protein
MERCDTEGKTLEKIAEVELGEEREAWFLENPRKRERKRKMKTIYLMMPSAAQTVLS